MSDRLLVTATRGHVIEACPIEEGKSCSWPRCEGEVAGVAVGHGRYAGGQYPLCVLHGRLLAAGRIKLPPPKRDWRGREVPSAG